MSVHTLAKQSAELQVAPVSWSQQRYRIHRVSLFGGDIRIYRFSRHMVPWRSERARSMPEQVSGLLPRSAVVNSPRDGTPTSVLPRWATDEPRPLASRGTARLSKMSAFATSCGVDCRRLLRGNHACGVLRAWRRAGPNIAKPNRHRRCSSAKVCVHGNLVAFPAGFFCERRFACSFWHSRAVRNVRFCDDWGSRREIGLMKY